MTLSEEDLLRLKNGDGEIDINEYELGTEHAAFICYRSIDGTHYTGFDKDEELQHSELPPDRQLRDD